MQLPVGKNIRLFKNPILERLTYVHPLTPGLMWGSVGTALIILSLEHLSLRTILSYAALGLFFWTLAEYLLHRFVFHFHPTTDWGKRFIFLIHGIHHDDPNDARRLLMPPSAAAILAVIFYSLFFAVFGPVLTKPFFSGFLLGYLCYDYIHFSTHFVKARGPILLFLKRYHLAHHFQTPDLRYGVSNPLWDYVFRTKGVSGNGRRIWAQTTEKAPDSSRTDPHGSSQR